MQDCADTIQFESKVKQTDLRCPRCSAEELGFGNNFCEKHGIEHIDYKCSFCCSIALFKCNAG